MYQSLNGINTPHDVAIFFMHLVFERNIDIHPDTNFHDYVDAKGNPSFTAPQAEQCEKDMENSFDVCEKYGLDVYKIAAKILSLYHYCDKNKVMSDFMDNI